jgi:hypothetical protein
MNIRLALVLAIVASFLAGSMATAQQAEVAAPPAKATVPAKAKAPASAEIVVVDPSGTGGTPSGKQIFAKDRATAINKCKAQCPWGGTLTPSVPPSDYWYCTCKSAIAE